MNEWSFFVQMVGTNFGNVLVSLRGNTKMDESKMTVFKMAAIINLSENE